MDKKNIIITGVTSGIGYETAKKLFLAGHNLIMGNRNMEKALRVKQELSKLGDGNIDFLEIDLSSFSSIRLFANEVITRYKRIDLLINNAGVFSRNDSYTKEGLELAKGVNHIGTYYLTELLLPRLLETPGSKVVMVSSVGCYLGKIKSTKNFFLKKTSNFRDYFDSKLANLFYAKDLSDKYPSLIVKAADPGIAYSKIWKWKTRFGRSLDNLYRRLTKTSEEASRIIVQLAITDKFDNDQSLLYKYSKPLKLPRIVNNKFLRNEVLKSTEEIVRQYS
jgi:NAD(P)-dependent dehydrogenase (short-subunit alcohol dehydrogenase family)